MKAEVDKLDINKPVNVATKFSNFKTNVDNVDVGKLKTVFVDLKKLSYVWDNEVVENTKFNTLNTKVNKLDKKTPHVTALIHINQYNTDKQNLVKKFGDIDKKNKYKCFEYKISEFENKIPDTSSLVTTNVPNAKISKVENKIPDHAKYVTNQEFIKLTREMFAVRLKQANSVHKIDFDNKLIRSNRRFSWNNAKYLEDQKKLNSLIRTDYNFFLGWIYFTTNDGSQNTFVYQSTLIV